MNATHRTSESVLRLGALVEPDGLITDGDWIESKDQDPSGDVRLIQLADIGDGAFLDKSSRFMRRDQSERLGCTYLEPGDVLISRMADPLGRACVFPGLDRRSVTVVDVCLVRPSPGRCDPHWLKYAINDPSTRARIGALASGTTRARVSRSKLAELELRVPSLAEQRRIVAHLDACFDRTKRAKKALDEVPALLDRLRQSILAAAFRGDLTADWRAEHPDVEPASELLKRIRVERRRRWEEAELAKMIAKGKAPKDDRWKANYEEPEPVDGSELPELPEAWCWASVDELAEVVRGASPRPAGDPKYFGGPVPWITVREITKDDAIEIREVSETLTELGKENSRFIEPGTFLLSNSGATLGVPKVTRLGGCINDGVVALLGLDEATKLYLYYFLSSQTAALRSLNQGAAQPNLNTTIVRRIKVPVPPEGERDALVSTVAAALERTRALRRETSTARGVIETVNAALLARAFSGDT